MRFQRFFSPGGAARAMYQANSLVATAFEADHLVIMDPLGHKFYGLDEAGARIWQFLVEPHTLDEVIEALERVYDAQPMVLRVDCTEFLDRLLDANLVKRLERR